MADQQNKNLVSLKPNIALRIPNFWLPSKKLGH